MMIMSEADDEQSKKNEGSICRLTSRVDSNNSVTTVKQKWKMNRGRRKTSVDGDAVENREDGGQLEETHSKQQEETKLR